MPPNRPPDPLIRDPYAKILVAGAGTGVWEYMLNDDFVAKVAEIDAEVAAIFEHMGNYQAVRTHFFDAYFAKAAAAGHPAGRHPGVRSRLPRVPTGLACGHQSSTRSISPRCSSTSRTTLAEHGVQPSADRHEVPIDLRLDWPTALRDAGFDPAQPTAWLAEGLLMYLPSDAQDRLFEQITELSAPGSRIAAETAGVSHAEDRREDMRKRFAAVRRAVRHGRRPLDIQDLMYDDPDRAERHRWLDRARLAGIRRSASARRDATTRTAGSTSPMLRRATRSRRSS